MPKRIQRKRTKGWRLPEGAIIVDRTTPWGNPFVIGRDGTREECVHKHRMLLCGFLCVSSKVSIDEQVRYQKYVLEHVSHLYGKVPCCFCPEDKSCHGDTLARFAATFEVVHLWPPGRYELDWDSGPFNLRPVA